MISLSGTGLDALAHRIQQEVDTGNITAAQLAIGLDGEVAHFQSFGTATTTDRFIIFSATKALVAMALLPHFADGTLGHLDLIIPIQGDFEEGFQVFGEHGSVVARGYLPWFHKASHVECFTAADRQYHRVLGEDAYSYKLQIERFADTILHGTLQQGASIDDGVAAMRAMVAIARSAESGQWVRLDAVSGGVADFAHTLIIAEENSQVTYVDDLISQDTGAAFHSGVVEIFIRCDQEMAIRAHHATVREHVAAWEEGRPVNYPWTRK